MSTTPPDAALTSDPITPIAPATDEPVAAVHSHTAALVLLALLTLVWGVHWAVVKIGLDYLPPYTYAALRVLTALITVVALLAWKGRLQRPERSNLSIVFSVGLAQIAAGVLLRRSRSRSCPLGGPPCSCTRCRCGSRCSSRCCSGSGRVATSSSAW